MASKVFKNKSNVVKTVKNRAGGNSVELTNKETLAKYVTTCTFNDTYYASGEKLLDEIKSVIDSITDNVYIAKCAVYSRETDGLKDMPAYLLNVLYDRDKGLFENVFPRVIDSGRMLRTFVSIARSEQFGRNLSSRVMRRVFQKWFDSKTPEWLFSNSLGNDPSFADIIKMTHAKGNKNQDLFSYFLSKDYNKDNLPKKLQDYLNWQNDRALPVPDVNFRMLDSFKLSTDEWSKVLRSCSWNTLRMNLATFERHGVFKTKENLKYACKKLEDNIPKNIFPYEVFAAYLMNKNNLTLSNSLNEVMEKSIENIPFIKGKTIVAVDVSASMCSSVSTKSSMRIVDVASMFGASISKRCENVKLVTFDTSVRTSVDNPSSSILTLANSLVANGGGTSIHSVLDYINNNKIEFDNLIIVSDNESWKDGYTCSFGESWNKMSKNKKLISIDIVPNSYTNANNRKNNLFVGGFNDSVWTVIKNFLENSEKFTCQIEKVMI